jgi:hypothetical protein
MSLGLLGLLGHPQQREVAAGLRQHELIRARRLAFLADDAEGERGERLLAGPLDALEQRDLALPTDHLAIHHPLDARPRGDGALYQAAFLQRRTGRVDALTALCYLHRARERADGAIRQAAQAGLLESLAEVRRHLLVGHQPLQTRRVGERRHVHRAGRNRAEPRELVPVVGLGARRRDDGQQRGRRSQSGERSEQRADHQGPSSWRLATDELGALLA